ncbi:uncharacterized protein BO97DRAFT_428909 [Aspergillus homomorphus CBS 101889]|uniref:Uncharacterized protein n=1 Tax=Aspergillus homomorphus (strain CBS 101889) TaxID=1450537 RepID=A0A395HLX4_ASPHC|nr:hypothetical protein BO97DRAFT_428909 [Aspergillus homomorphus CBS 101889]RAL07868.1 hypothetical protein BO97DRAFT_428909 [Aspergillus homomorphus CBS 101889]
MAGVLSRLATTLVILLVHLQVAFGVEDVRDLIQFALDKRREIYVPANAKGDVLSGLQVAETACGITTLRSPVRPGRFQGHGDQELQGTPGELSLPSSLSIPAMIPPRCTTIAIITDNTDGNLERDPEATTILIQLAKEAGVPPSVINNIHG